MNEFAVYTNQRSKFAQTLERLKKISHEMHGKPTKQRGAWTSTLLYRICVNGDTLMAICPVKNTSLDHFAIAVLSRSIIETGIMLFYVTDPTITQQQWALYRDILYLHDCISRLRIFKAIDVSEEAQTGRNHAADLRKRIQGNPEFNNFDAEQQARLLSGETLYVNGIRSVVRSAGFSNKWFETVYVTLSSFIHSTPFSLADAVERKIWQGNSPYAYYISGLALELTWQMLEAVATRLKTVPLPGD